MRRFAPLLVALTLLPGLPDRPAAGADIVVDGAFEDWADVPPAVVDVPGDAGPSGIDFGAVSAWSDAERLTLRFDTGSDIVLQRRNAVVLAIDTDRSADTGVLVNGIGADFRWRFGEREGTAYPLGVWVRVPHAAVGFRQAPTHSGTEFEIALDRRGLVAGAPLMPGDSIAVVLYVDEPGGDAVPDSGALVLELRSAPPSPAAPASIARVSPSSVRLLTYNVLFDGLFLRQEEFARILHAISPDVLSLQEVRGHTPEEARDLVRRMVRGDTWYASEGGRGVIVSRYPIVQSGSIGGDRGTTWALIRIPVDDADTDLLVLNPQTPCCEDDVGRQEELDRVAAWIRDAQAGGDLLAPGTPIVVAGDLNLVGYGRQLRTLLEGEIVDVATHGAGRPLDWDGTPLSDPAPRHTTGREAYTWRGDDSPFAPGRLDFVLYTDSVLELEKAFVLWSPDLTARDLERTGLYAEDTAIASDHLPVVVDFILPRPGSRAGPGGGAAGARSPRSARP